MQRLGPEQKALISGSFDAIADNLEALVADFYRRLFDAAPATRALFAEDVDSQLEKMLRSLEFLIEVLDRPEQLRDYARMIGKTHTDAGTLTGHFEVFVPVFTASVKAFSPDWSAAHDAAWPVFLEDVAAMMGFPLQA